MPSSSRATVPTEKPARYIKQLGSHFGQKIDVTERDDATVLAFPMGECELRDAGSAIAITATASSDDDLERLEGVVGRHLERFGARDELTVTWTR